MEPSTVLSIRGLSKRYPGRRGVQANDGVDLDVLAGQVVGLLGHNGAGKTTLVNQVVGLVRPDAGSIWLDVPETIFMQWDGRLAAGVSAKDMMLAMLGRFGMNGGRYQAVEYTGDAVRALPMPERMTLANMGAELGATTSIFPSDKHTKAYLEAQGRGEVWKDLGPDEGATYDEHVEIDLDKLEPLVACPHSPDNVKTVREVAGQKAAQASIGSCTNSSYEDLTGAAHMLKGRQVAAGTSFTVTPGSKHPTT